MKLAIQICLLFLACASAQQPVASGKPASGTPWVVRESFVFRGSKFILEASPQSAPDVFDRLRIKAPGRREFIKQNTEPWVKLTTAFYKDEKYHSVSNNVLQSRYILGVTSPDPKSPMLLFLMGSADASSTEPLEVLSFDRSGQITSVLSKDELHLINVADLDGDGKNEIVGLPCFHQETGELTTYDPFHVYKISPKTKKAKFSLELSKRYNIQNYAGWVGPECSEKFFTKKLANGKLVIVKR